MCIIKDNIITVLQLIIHLALPGKDFNLEKHKTTKNQACKLVYIGQDMFKIFILVVDLCL